MIPRSTDPSVKFWTEKLEELDHGALLDVLIAASSERVAELASFHLAPDSRLPDAAAAPRFAALNARYQAAWQCVYERLCEAPRPVRIDIVESDHRNTDG